VDVDGTGPAVVETYDGHGRLVDARTTAAATVVVSVPARGFAVVRR
jgi:hypothetical protein